MCGIFGLNKFSVELLKNSRESLKLLKHRGPDQWDDYFDSKIYIGHQRLSILDLTKEGKQPMMCQNKDVIITVNGEIYNFLKLKGELERKYTFRSTSDSEVLLYGYKEWGIDLLLEKIDGMYALCIYDKQKELLFLARDRVGIKPLYYSSLNDQICWASELKAIKNFYHDTDFLQYDYTALYDFLTYKFIPAPKSVFKNINKLEAGHYLEININNNDIKKVQYWKLEIIPCKDNIEKAKKKIYDLVKESLDEQMIADVPVGFFLSGGMDSSTLVAVASQNHTNINTFSIGFKDKSHDETFYSDIIAEKYQTNHNKKILDEKEIKILFNKIKDWFDEPFGDTSCFPTYLVSKFAKKETTVVLSGDGGDEIFGGYNWYKKFEKAQNTTLKRLKFLKPIVKTLNARSAFLKKFFRKMYIILISDEIKQYAIIRGSLLDSQKEKYKKIWEIDSEYDDFWYFKKHYKKELPLYTRLQYLDFHTYLPDDILTKVDRVSMAVSLECRVPFLKKEIIEYSFSLNEDVRIYNNELKGLMKEAFNNFLPNEIIKRSKRGFSLPISNLKTFTENKRSKQEKILTIFGFNDK